MIFNRKVYKTFSVASFYSNLNNKLVIGNNMKRNASNSINGVLYFLKINNQTIDLFFDAEIIRNIGTYNSCRGSKCGKKAECVSKQNEIGFKCFCLSSFKNCDKSCNKKCN